MGSKRIAERAEGLYREAVKHAANNSARFTENQRTFRDAEILGRVLDKSETEVARDIDKCRKEMGRA